MTPFLSALTRKALKDPQEDVSASDTMGEEDGLSSLSATALLHLLLESATLDKKSVTVVAR